MNHNLFILFFLPWIDKSPVRSIRYKGRLSQAGIVLFVISFIGLGYLGSQPVSTLRSLLAQVFTVGYFVFFLAMPFYSRYEKAKPVPEHISQC